jgi:hypothetical protein
VREQARTAGLLSDDDFTVAGISLRTFRRKDADSL